MGFCPVVAAEGDDNAELARLLERAELVQDAGRIGIHDCDIINNRWEWDARVRAMWGIGADEEVTYKTFIEGIHEDDRDQAVARLEAAIAPGSDGDYVAQYRVCGRGDGIVRWIEATGRVTFAGGVAARMVGTVRDVSEEKIARDQKAAAEAFSQHLIESAPTILYIYDLVERRNLFMGPQIAELTGYDVALFKELKSELIATVTHPDDIARIAEHHRAIRAGEVQPPFHIEYRMLAADGRWIWLASTEVIHTRDVDGRPRRILGAALDITARREAEQARELLTHEVSHRARNLLAMVSSLANLTLRQACSADEWPRFEGRLKALAAAQGVLSQADWRSADLRDLIAGVLEPFGDPDRGGIASDGPAFTVPAEAAMPLTLIFHELATNAVKYGALSTSAGRLTVNWTAFPEGVDLEWRESGGPLVTAPERSGFGSLLIERSLSAGQGRAELVFQSTGVVCRLKLFGAPA